MSLSAVGNTPSSSDDDDDDGDDDDDDGSFRGALPAKRPSASGIRYRVRMILIILGAQVSNVLTF